MAEINTSDAGFLATTIAKVAVGSLTGSQADLDVDNYRKRGKFTKERAAEFDATLLAISVAAERVCQNRL